MVDLAKYRTKKQKRRKPRRRSPSYGGVEIEAGYESSDNSFSLTVIINPHRGTKNLTKDQIADLVERLAQEGHFDNSPNNPVADLRWVFFNRWQVTRRNVRIGRGKARLTGFARIPPGSL